jgi:DNA ligase (NAD+)
MIKEQSDNEVYKISLDLINSPAQHTLSYVKELGAILRFHEWKYYVLDSPIISDFEYDQLFKKLQEVETNHPEWILADSPSQRVSSDLTETFSTVEHLTPMLSLDNSYNADDLQKFDDQIKKLTGLEPNTEVIYTVEPKFDGGSVAIIYENDMLIRGATRGNGEKGEEITPNVRQISTIPLSVNFKALNITKAELRGEAVINKARFTEINLERESQGKTLFANPRNTATGGLRTKDPKETRDRGTEIFIFQLGYAVDDEGNDQLQKLEGHYHSVEVLSQIGFKVDREIMKQCRGIDEVIAHCALWEEKRDSYPYEIDGMVVKVDNYALQELCGSTSHHPRWAIAFKFRAKQATTILENVEFQIGKIGSVTPVAKVTPVSLAGVTVSSISLHNEDFIIKKDLRIGDKIIIERAGDVIPYVVKSLDELRIGKEEKIQFPTSCPACKTPLYKEEGEAAWRCPNYNCSAQILQRMFHHVSKDAMDIDGFGPSYIERFNELGWIHSLVDIYRLDYKAIAELEGFGEKSAQKLKASIELAKQNPISRLLHGLSIHHLGKNASKLIAGRIGHVLDLKDWTFEDFTAIDEIGPVVANNVTAFFAVPENVEMLREMENLGVNLAQTEADKPKIVAEDAILKDKTILFTGTLQKMGRKEAQSLAEEFGAKNISAVSSNLDILVVGEKAGSKLKKAEAIGSVEILTEDAFLELIGKK